ncbi:hypothetical protein XELAEV_180348232mg, partial [Xenopus laevis]
MASVSFAALNLHVKSLFQEGTEFWAAKQKNNGKGRTGHRIPWQGSRSLEASSQASRFLPGDAPFLMFSEGGTGHWSPANGSRSLRERSWQRE